jgi:hypothetical protein
MGSCQAVAKRSAVREAAVRVQLSKEGQSAPLPLPGYTQLLDFGLHSIPNFYFKILLNTSTSLHH